jgi:predicted DNA-binding protein with PD1-like motif
MEQIAFRLCPGQDLKEELDQVVNVSKIEAGCVLTCVGSLTRAVIRFANQSEAEVLDGHFEIVSLTGVLSKDGSHYHISVSDEEGRTTGGHLMDGCKVYTTAEIVIGVMPKYEFTRKFDPQTGFPELDVLLQTRKGD